MPQRRWLGPLGLRLAAAFVAVALGALAVLSVAVLLVDRSDVNHLASDQRDQTTDAITSALTDEYRVTGSWSGADLQPAVALVDSSGIALALNDAAGGAVLRAGPQQLFSESGSKIVHERVMVDNSTVGALKLGFAAGGLSASERHLRGALLAAIGWSAALAAGVAFVVAAVVARGLVGPIRRLSSAARALGTGTSHARVGPDAGPGELGELGRAFDSMAESLEREDRLRRTLVADVAHELRTPVAVLQAETEALLDGISQPSAQTLASLHDETVRLGRMVEDLQTLASAEAAGLHLDKRRLDLSRVAAEAADSFAQRLRAAGIGLDQSLPPAVVTGDPYRLRQVVTNLLSNAMKFTPSGGKLTLTVRADGHDAVLEVSDTGPGIPDDEQAMVWERFYRGTSGRTTAGSGIGLAVVKELTVAHGGSVELERAPGGGARFVVRLPLALQSGEPATGT